MFCLWLCLRRVTRDWYGSGASVLFFRSPSFHFTLYHQVTMQMLSVNLNKQQLSDVIAHTATKSFRPLYFVCLGVAQSVDRGPWSRGLTEPG